MGDRGDRQQDEREDRVIQHLRERFGHDDFRPGQWEPVQAVLEAFPDASLESFAQSDTFEPTKGP